MTKITTLNDFSLLRKAIEFACQKHGDQLDKSFLPAIYHPLKVARDLGIAGYPPIVQTVGVLHDILEDTDTGSLDIFESFGLDIKWAVVSVTRRKDETYNNFILRAKENPIGRIVKIFDIKDNISRLNESDSSMIKRYEKALELLEVTGLEFVSLKKCGL